jgi:hypothetical protein
VGDRIVYVQLKTGYDLDRGRSGIARVPLLQVLEDGLLRWATHRRSPGLDANVYDVETQEEFGSSAEAWPH